MIELINLTKSYRTPKGRHYVFRNLNFKFPEGIGIGLMGRNGAGKSTLMRLIGGMDTPDSGRVVTNKRISWTVGLGSGFPEFAEPARQRALCGPAVQRVTRRNAGKNPLCRRVRRDRQSSSTYP